MKCRDLCSLKQGRVSSIGIYLTSRIWEFQNFLCFFFVSHLNCPFVKYFFQFSLWTNFNYLKLEGNQSRHHELWSDRQTEIPKYRYGFTYQPATPPFPPGPWLLCRTHPGSIKEGKISRFVNILEMWTIQPLKKIKGSGHET